LGGLGGIEVQESVFDEAQHQVVEVGVAQPCQGVQAALEVHLGAQEAQVHGGVVGAQRAAGEVGFEALAGAAGGDLQSFKAAGALREAGGGVEGDGGKALVARQGGHLRAS
jgi:hypothetical protein